MSSLPISTSGPREQINLRGPWQLAFDPKDEGHDRGWTHGHWPGADSVHTDVPGLWNLTHPDAEGVGFYRREIPLPETWSGRALRLRFGGASYRTEAWLNGLYLGSHEGAYTPFSFDLGRAARLGEDNELVVRVAALSRTRHVDGMVLTQCPASKQSWHYSYGGLWGDVVLEASATVWTKDLFVEPDLEHERVAIGTLLDNREGRCRQVRLGLEILAPDGEPAARRDLDLIAPPGETAFDFRFDLPQPRPWSIESPDLYQARVALSESGREIDSLATPFGLRDFTVRDGEFFLNGQRIFLRGVILQPNYPVELVKLTTPEMMEREVALVKDVGFNLIRTHIQPSPPGYLDLTDRMGVLVYAESDMAWIEDSPRLLDHGRRELKAFIENERNHPSVVIWGIHNENRAASHKSGEGLTRFVRALDPTRVIVDNSGGTLAIDQDFGWSDETTVIPNRETRRQETRDLHIYTGAPVTNEVYEWLRTLGTHEPAVDMAAERFGSQAVMRTFHEGLRSYSGGILVSELGCGGLSDLDAVVAAYGGKEHLQDAREAIAFQDSLHQGFQERRLDRVFGSIERLVRATQEQQARGNARQVEALLVNPRISGYILTQLNDVAWEFHAGVLDVWRNPKRAYEAAKRLNRPQCLVLKAAAPVVTCGTPIRVDVNLVAGRPLQGGERLSITCFDPEASSGRMLESSLGAGQGIVQLEPVVIDDTHLAGTYKVTASLQGPNGTLAESIEEVLALPAGAARLPVRWVGSPPRDRPEESKAGRAAARPSPSEVLVVAEPSSLEPAEWGRFLDEASDGRAAIVGPMRPEDEAAIQALTGRGLPIKLHFGIGNWMGCYHWIPASLVFEGLPRGGLASEVYADVLPRYVLSELGGEVIAGSFNNTQTRRDPPMMLWYSDLEVVPLGSGVLCLCQYRCFESAASNPLAARLADNLIRYMAGRTEVAR